MPTEDEFEQWVRQGATELTKTYTDEFVMEADPGHTEFVNISGVLSGCVGCEDSRENLVRAWITQEAGKGHWGYLPNWNDKFSYRIVLGGADEYGSIGFSQIINWNKYGNSPNPALHNINLYHPADGIRGFAVFSNDVAVASGGGGFKKAFVETGSGSYRKERTYAQGEYPHISFLYDIEGNAIAIGNKYIDDAKDLLSKGIMAYNRGPGLPWVKDHIWPEALAKYKPPDKDTGFGTRTAMKYTLNVQRNAGIALRKWAWTAQRINAGQNGICEISAHAEDSPITAEDAIPYQVCITPGNDGILNTTKNDSTIDDEITTFVFVYSEIEWFEGTEWHWKLNQCALLSGGCSN